MIVPPPSCVAPRKLRSTASSSGICSMTSKAPVKSNTPFAGILVASICTSCTVSGRRLRACLSAEGCSSEPTTKSQFRVAVSADKTVPLPQPISSNLRAFGKNLAASPVINSFRATNQKCLSSKENSSSNTFGLKPVTVSASSGANIGTPSADLTELPQAEHCQFVGQIGSASFIRSEVPQIAH